MLLAGAPGPLNSHSRCPLRLSQETVGLGASLSPCGWEEQLCLTACFHPWAHKCVKQNTAAPLCLQFQDVLFGEDGQISAQSFCRRSKRHPRQNILPILRHGPHTWTSVRGKAEKLGGGGEGGAGKRKKNLLWLGENNPEQRLLYCANINLGLLIILKVWNVCKIPIQNRLLDKNHTHC